MPHTVGFGNQERQVLSNDRLPPDVVPPSEEDVEARKPRIL